MGWFGSRIKDPVRGTAHVVSSTYKPSGAVNAPCQVSLVLTVDGQPSVAIDTVIRASYDRWPFPGMVLPIEASRADITRFKVLWSEMPTAQERATQAARAMADNLNGKTDTPPQATLHMGPVFRNTSVTVNGKAATPADIAQFEALTGMDLDGDGAVAGRTAAPAADRISELERLAALHAQGALTDSEFAAAKRNVLRNNS